MPEAKFESYTSSIFGDITSHFYSLEKETSQRIRPFAPGNGFNLKGKLFMARIFLFEPNFKPPPPHVNFSNLQAEEAFSFPTFFRRLDEKLAAATPLIDHFCQNFFRKCVKDKN